MVGLFSRLRRSKNILAERRAFGLKTRLGALAFFLVGGLALGALLVRHGVVHDPYLEYRVVQGLNDAQDRMDRVVTEVALGELTSEEADVRLRTLEGQLRLVHALLPRTFALDDAWFNTNLALSDADSWLKETLPEVGFEDFRPLQVGHLQDLADDYYADGQYDRALKTYREALFLEERLQAEAPGDFDSLSAKATLLERLGDTYFAVFAYEEALLSYMRSLTLKSALAARAARAAGAEDADGLAQRLESLAIAHFDLQRTLNGLEQRQAAAEVEAQGTALRRLAVAEGPDQPQILQAYAGTLEFFGDRYADRNDWHTALLIYREVRFLQRLNIALHADYSPAQEYLSYVKGRVGEALFETGHTEDALATYRDSMALARDLTTEGSFNYGLNRQPALMLEFIAEALLKQGETEAAREAHKKAIGLLRPLTRDYFGADQLRFDLTRNLTALVDLKLQAKEPRETVGLAQEAVAVAGELAGANAFDFPSRDAYSLSLDALARALWVSGDRTEALKTQYEAVDFDRETAEIWPDYEGPQDTLAYSLTLLAEFLIKTNSPATAVAPAAEAVRVREGLALSEGDFSALVRSYEALARAHQEVGNDAAAADFTLRTFQHYAQAAASTQAQPGAKRQAVLRAGEILAQAKRFVSPGNLHGTRATFLEILDAHFPDLDRDEELLRLRREATRDYVEGLADDPSQALVLTEFLKALAEPNPASSTQDRAWALVRLGQSYSRQSKPLDAVAAFERGIALQRSVTGGKDRAALANALSAFARHHVKTTGYRRALPLLEEALRIRLDLATASDVDSASHFAETVGLTAMLSEITQRSGSGRIVTRTAGLFLDLKKQMLEPAAENSDAARGLSLELGRFARQMALSTAPDQTIGVVALSEDLLEAALVDQRLPESVYEVPLLATTEQMRTYRLLSRPEAALGRLVWLTANLQSRASADHTSKAALAGTTALVAETYALAQTDLDGENLPALATALTAVYQKSIGGFEMAADDQVYLSGLYRDVSVSLANQGFAQAAADLNAIADKLAPELAPGEQQQITLSEPEEVIVID